MYISPLLFKLVRPIGAVVPLLISWSVAVDSAQACSVSRDYVPPAPGPLSRGEALSAYAGVGVAASALAVTGAWALDATGQFPVLGTALSAAPGVFVSSFILMPPPSGSGDCGDGTLQWSEFAERAWIPGLLGIVPSVLAWWISGSSFDAPPVIVNANLDYQGVVLVGRF